MSNEVFGTVPTEENIKGYLNASSGYDGKSAYELAVKNGFKGTEKEWLASLAVIRKDTEFVFVGGDAEQSTSAEVVIDGAMSDTSQNSVMNKVVKAYVDKAKDYIVEQDTTTAGWTYRKWNSGIAECWINQNVKTDLTSKENGIYYSTNNFGGIAYPFTFVGGYPKVSVNLIFASANFLYLSCVQYEYETMYTQLPNYRLISQYAVENSNNYTACFYVIGRYK